MASPTKPARSTRKTTRPPARPTDSPSDGYGDAFPNSTKVYVDGPEGIRVPMRESGVSGGEPPLRVYDTSGPQGFDVRDGLPSLRDVWIRQRDVGPVPHPEGAQAPEGSAPRGTGAQRDRSLAPLGMRY